MVAVSQPQHAIDEDGAIKIGVGEAVGIGHQLAMNLTVGKTKRIEVGSGQMAHDAVGPDEHQGADGILGRAQRRHAGDISNPDA